MMPSHHPWIQWIWHNHHLTSLRIPWPWVQGQGVSTVHRRETLLAADFRRRVSRDADPSSAKNSWREKMQLLQDYHTASVWLFWLNSWIYMNPSCISIWNPSRLSGAHRCLAGGTFFVSSKCAHRGRLKCCPEKNPHHNSKKHETSKIPEYFYLCFRKKNPS